MPPLNREHNVRAPFKIDKGRLTFRTDGALFAQEAQRAKENNRNFTVCLIDAEPIREFTGGVENVELVTGRPARWEITMRGKERER